MQQNLRNNGMSSNRELEGSLIENHTTLGTIEMRDHPTGCVTRQGRQIAHWGRTRAEEVDLTYDSVQGNSGRVGNSQSSGRS